MLRNVSRSNLVRKVTRVTVDTIGTARHAIWFMLIVCSAGTKDMIANATVQSTVAFFSALAGIKITSVTTNMADLLFAAGISAALTFSISISVQRLVLKTEGKAKKRKR